MCNCACVAATTACVCVQLRQLFGFCGTVRDCRFVGIARTYAFVEFDNEEVCVTRSKGPLGHAHLTDDRDRTISASTKSHIRITPSAGNAPSLPTRPRGAGPARATLAVATTCRLREHVAR